MLETSGLSLINQNIVAGVDEAGRGALAGPVFAASVIVDLNRSPLRVADSKLLSPKIREEVYEEIIQSAVSWGVGFATPNEIAEHNILNASLLAMKRAVDNLNIKPDVLLIDGRDKIESDLSQLAVIDGDNLCVSISAASIIAKVTRDRLMIEHENTYPQFSFSKHKGYGTKLHFEEIKKFGASTIHRKSFKGVV